MLLEESDSEVSVEKEAVEKENPRVSNWNFLPCSFKVLLLIPVITLLGYWTTSWIFPERILGRHRASTSRFCAGVPLPQGEIKPATGSWNLTTNRTDVKALVMYSKLASKIEGCSCCLYYNANADKEKRVVKIEWDKGWINKENTAGICGVYSDDGAAFHLKLSKGEHTVRDFKINTVAVQRHYGLTYAKWFWVIREKREYLICDLVDDRWVGWAWRKTLKAC